MGPGRRLGAGSKALIVLTLVGLAGLGTVSIYRVFGTLEPVTGVEWVQTSSGPIAVAILEESPAWTAGLRPGDYLEAVNGRPVESALDASTFAWGREGDVPSVLEIRRGRERFTVDLRPGFVYRTEPYGYLSLVGFAFLFTGAFIAFRWRAVRGAPAYALLAAGLFGYLVFSHTGRADFLDWTFYWLDLLAGVTVPALLIQLSLELTRSGKTRRFIPLLYLPAAAILLAALWMHPAALGGAYRFNDPAGAVELLDRLQILFLGVAVAVAALIMLKAYGRSRSTQHTGQLRWMLWGLFVGLAPFTILYAIPWALNATDLPGWAQFLSVLPMLLVPAAFTAALVRYRLHDVNMILRTVLVEAASIFLTFAAYGVVVYTLRHGLSDILPLSKSSTRYIGIFLTAISYPRIRSRMLLLVSQAFFRRRYSYRATLLDWARELNSENDLVSLARLLRDRITQTLDLGMATLFVMTGSDTFESVGEQEGVGKLVLDEATLQQVETEPYVHLAAGELSAIPWARYLFGMRVKGGLCALIATSERSDHSESLSSEDRALLSTFSAHAATAIDSALLFQELRRRAAEVERLHSQQATILESSAVGLLMLDEEERILTWNNAMEEMYKLPREAAIGRSLQEVFPPDQVRILERFAPGGDGGGDNRRFRYTMTNRDGDKVVVNIAVSKAAGDSGDGKVRVVAFDDVTEQIRLEEQMVQQERLASLGMLAAGVAHEVNTPLTGISSYAQIMIDDLPEGDPRREMLQRIDEQTRRASDIANSLLNFARPEEASFEPLDINMVTRECLSLFVPQIKGRKIQVEEDFEEEIPSILGHKGKLQQVLLNLLMNARDALAPGGTITIRTRGRDGRVRLDVLDNGRGIQEEDLVRVFDPFFSTKGRGEGTGLGLSISYGIVRDHGGDMRVVSVPGDFTRFTLDLPVADTARVPV
ncbi:MAG: PAS domain S-box protein [Acidobacteria bacterium]|uniref:histidine kinase n=1 Tax=Candidatus Polarisedimenticola svalbardensis TaxID=2886004 RepID=A0A8J7CKX9_9BACT|nr:PAS domain S-box protein [Candidatus Polarisedimenticola svalbardensis]